MWPALVRDLVERQPYPDGSIDRALLGAQTLLTPETRARLYAPPAAPGDRGPGRPWLRQIVTQTIGAERQPLAQLAALTRWCSRIPRDFPEPANSTAAGYYGDFGGFFWGGDEEAVIAKGSPWPQEVARTLATLILLAGFPSRLVFLYRAEPPLLHTVVEAWVNGSWTVYDACANRWYLWPHHGFASALDLQQQPRLVDQAPEHGRNPYVDSAFYRTVAIGDYPLAGHDSVYERNPVRPKDRMLLQQANAVFAAG